MLPLFCILVATAFATSLSFASEVSQGSEGSLALNLQHRLSSNSEFVDRNTVTAIPVYPKWKTQTQFSGKITADQIPVLTESVQRGDYYSIRVLSNPNDPASDYVQTSIRMCFLVASDWKHDVVFGIHPTGYVTSLEIRPALSSSFTTCEGVEKKPLPVSEFVLPSRFGVLTSESTPAIPIVPIGKGFPYPGQSESEASTLYQASSGGDTDEKTKKPETQEKSFFAQNWHYLILVFLVLRMLGGAAEQKSDAAGGAAKAGPARG